MIIILIIILLTGNSFGQSFKEVSCQVPYINREVQFSLPFGFQETHYGYDRTHYMHDFKMTGLEDFDIKLRKTYSYIDLIDLEIVIYDVISNEDFKSDNLINLYNYCKATLNQPFIVSDSLILSSNSFQFELKERDGNYNKYYKYKFGYEQGIIVMSMFEGKFLTNKYPSSSSDDIWYSITYPVLNSFKVNIKENITSEQENESYSMNDTNEEIISTVLFILAFIVVIIISTFLISRNHNTECQTERRSEVKILNKYEEVKRLPDDKILIGITCNSCGKKYKLMNPSFNKKYKCKKCEADITVYRLPREEILKILSTEESHNEDEILIDRNIITNHNLNNEDSRSVNVANNSDNNPIYYNVSIERFLFMIFISLGLFIIYWSYKNWKSIKETNSIEISPILRGIFSAYYIYPLLVNIQSNNKLSIDKKDNLSPGKLYLGMIVTNLLGRSFNVIDNDYGQVLGIIVIMLSFLFLIPAQKYINKINIDKNYSEWSTGLTIVVILGVIIWLCRFLHIIPISI